ncbi:hypothetical protein B9Z55_022391 [Caenorhabditis nigoni]|uniref:Uncharacterized protein n=1 Tax=Caenorhabditis nigoni TaxID=1611254 RepID=A0A2G5SKG5_9PELO|nr:hypothetical protein B9Z55_022391 [Caenorhabditis nigoni]
MTTIGSKPGSSKDRPVEKYEKIEVITARRSSWTEAMQNQVTLRERKKLVKGYADIIGTSEKVVESVCGQLDVYSKCSERPKDVIEKPVRAFFDELDGWRREKDKLEEELAISRRAKDEVARKLEEVWKAAEKAEETIVELERALQKEKKTYRQAGRTN